jgi:hypothetical protein
VRREDATIVASVSIAALVLGHLNLVDTHVCARTHACGSAPACCYCGPGCSPPAGRLRWWPRSYSMVRAPSTKRMTKFGFEAAAAGSLPSTSGISNSMLSPRPPHVTTRARRGVDRRRCGDVPRGAAALDLLLCDGDGARAACSADARGRAAPAATTGRRGDVSMCEMWRASPRIIARSDDWLIL